jgi:hypothetical protein
VLRSLTLLGLTSEANEFFDFLKRLRDSKLVEFEDESFGYWRRAVTP